MAGPSGLAEQQEPVTVTTQLRGAAFAFRARRSRCLAAEHRQLRGFGLEIDDGRHATLRLLCRRLAIVTPQFNCGDLRFRSPLERFRGTTILWYELPLKPTHR